MQARNMILTAVIGGPLAGLMMGIAANPTMVAPPEPSWRSARPDPVYREPQQIVAMGPQDLSPNWYVDRMPTWKRRAAEREAAAYAALQYADYPEPSPEPADPAREPPQASGAKIVTWPAAAPMAEAAADRAPESDARTPAGSEAEAQPALVDAAPAPAL